MTHVSFYHLTKSLVDETLPRLLEHTLKAGKKALVRAHSSERVDSLSIALWTKYNDSWLPHGTEKDDYAEDQPIWLAINDKNPNSATFVFSIDGVEIQDANMFERCFVLFDGKNDKSIVEARNLWRLLNEAGHDMYYWQQNEKGIWKEKVN